MGLFTPALPGAWGGLLWTHRTGSMICALLRLFEQSRLGLVG
jgi:hypothetical protein